ncbi:MAG: M3 family oligoendopeptidase [Chthonomonas sp.]|nr:M3 family oligoendopeptidase [Chthonomonas sp.]
MSAPTANPHKSWSDFEPTFTELENRPVDAANLEAWLADWSKAQAEVEDLYSRLNVATTVDTTDAAAEDALTHFLDEVFEPYALALHKLKDRLVELNPTQPDLMVTVRNMRADAEAFCEANLELQTEENKLGMEYDKVIGAQTVEWDGEEITLSRLSQQYQSPDRAVRQRAYEAEMGRRLADRDTLNSLWAKFLTNRRQQAKNAGFGDNFGDLQWKRMHRFDYSPADCRAFHAAIEERVVPAMERVLERRRSKLGLDTLRPWDSSAPAPGETPLRPFNTDDELINPCLAIFDQVDPVLGDNYRTMVNEGLLDLGNRKGKAPGGYCTSFALSRRPFIFMNAVGLHGDVQTLLHEAGHAFHVFESASLPYTMQMETGSEVAEVASMSMELLAAPYLEKSKGGYYTAEEAKRARIEHLEKCILFWPYMSVVDAFQLWVYENPDAALDAKNCDAEWTKLWHRFMKGVDYSGLDEIVATGWHRKLHIFQVPFYYIEYGLAQLGAMQVWNNSLSDEKAAVAAYRKALSLGGTVSISEFFRTAGGKFAFDSATVGQVIDLIERTIAELS